MSSNTRVLYSSNKYNEACLVKETFGESNDCSVISLSIVGNVSYLKARRYMEEQGRSHRGTAYKDWILNAADRLGLGLKKVESPAKTIRTLGRQLPVDKKYLVFVRGHVLACADGQVHDWTEGRLHRIQEMYEVT